MVAGLGSAWDGDAVVLTLTEIADRGDLGGADPQPVHHADVADGTTVLVRDTHPPLTEDSVDSGAKSVAGLDGSGHSWVSSLTP